MVVVRYSIIALLFILELVVFVGDPGFYLPGGVVFEFVHWF
jgi:hypothetical protein